MNGELNSILADYEDGKISRRDVLSRFAFIASLVGVGSCIDGTETERAIGIPEDQSEALEDLNGWKKELIERLTNARYDETTCEITGEVWPGPYGGMMHEEWLLHGTHDGAGGVSRWKFKNTDATLPDAATRTDDALARQIPNHDAAAGPRDFAAATPGRSPGASNAQVIHSTNVNALKVGAMEDYQNLLFYVLRARIRKERREACQLAIENFADYLDRLTLPGQPADAFKGRANIYINSSDPTNPTDPIPGGDGW